MAARITHIRVCKLIAVCIFQALTVVSLASAEQEAAEPLSDQPAAARSAEELEDLRFWVEIVKNPSVNLDQRISSARKLLAKDWPEALQEISRLLDNTDGSAACVPICHAIAENGPPRAVFMDSLLTLLGDADNVVRAAAARALAHYDEAGVSERLIIVIRNHNAAARKRAAAINTLAQLPDSHRAAGTLIQLLDAGDSSIDEKLYEALTAVSGVELGSDAEAWRRWWVQHKDLTPEQWLKRQVLMLEERLLKNNALVRTYEQRLVSAFEQAAAKAPKDERKQLLRGYLSDDLEIVRLAAIDLIQRDIGDGKLPEEELVTALRGHMQDPSARVRKGVLNVLGNLRDRSDASAVIELLARDPDQSVRVAAIVTLGQLGNPAANQVLIEELLHPQGPAGCQVAAAKALGRLNPKGGAGDRDLSAVVAALLSTYESAPPQSDLQTACLHAMSLIAVPEFAPMLLANLQHDQVDVRLRCIEGLRNLGDHARLGGILPYVADPDARVRREVARAIGALGGQEADLPTLLNRLNPKIEQEPTVREIVWQSFVEVWAAMPDFATQVAWVHKLVEYPDYQVQLFQALEDQLNGSAENAARLLQIRQLLATLFEQQAMYAEAVKYWTLIQDFYVKSADQAAARNAAISLFVSMLLAEQDAEAIALVQGALEEDSAYFKPKLRDGVIAALTRERDDKRNERVQELLQVVNSHMTELLDEEFKNRLLPFENPEGQTAVDDETSPPSTVTNGGSLNSGAPNSG